MFFTSPSTCNPKNFSLKTIKWDLRDFMLVGEIPSDSYSSSSYLKIPSFWFLFPSEIGAQLRLVLLETAFEFFQNILGLFNLVRCLLNLRDMRVLKQASCHQLTSIWKIEEGSRYFLAMWIRRLQTSWNCNSFLKDVNDMVQFTSMRTMILAAVL